MLCNRSALLESIPECQRVGLSVEQHIIRIAVRVEAVIGDNHLCMVSRVVSGHRATIHTSRGYCSVGNLEAHDIRRGEHQGRRTGGTIAHHRRLPRERIGEGDGGSLVIARSRCKGMPVEGLFDGRSSRSVSSHVDNIDGIVLIVLKTTVRQLIATAEDNIDGLVEHSHRDIHRRVEPALVVAKLTTESNGEVEGHNATEVDMHRLRGSKIDNTVLIDAADTVEGDIADRHSGKAEILQREIVCAVTFVIDGDGCRLCRSSYTIDSYRQLIGVIGCPGRENCGQQGKR